MEEKVSGQAVTVMIYMAVIFIVGIPVGYITAWAFDGDYTLPQYAILGVAIIGIIICTCCLVGMLGSWIYRLIKHGVDWYN